MTIGKWLAALCVCVSLNVQSAPRAINVITLEKVNCEALAAENIVDYRLCLGWNLDRAAVKDIIKLGRLARMYNPVHDMSPGDLRIYYSADVTINGKPYSLGLYATSWFSLYDASAEEMRYFDCRRKRCDKYFLGNYISEGLMAGVLEEALHRLEARLKKKINTNRLRAWRELERETLAQGRFGAYSLAGGSTLSVSDKGCVLQDGQGNKRACFARERDEALLVYARLDRPDGSILADFGGGEKRYSDGDFIVSVEFAG